MPSNFYPKRPVKSFLDLEVYQKSLELAVFVARYVVRPVPDIEQALGNKSQNAEVELVPGGAEPTGHSAISGNAGSGAETAGQGDMLPKAGSTSEAGRLIFRQMLPCALGLPHLIAEAHSVRFGSKKDCLILLERAMLRCNKMVVYLEEARDIADTGLPWEKFNESIKKYIFVRQKILNLQRSWKKFMDEA